MSCDVPHQVPNRLETERSGKAPVLCIDLCVSWAIVDDIEPIPLHPWQLRVPTEMWDIFLADSGYRDIDVIELRRVMNDGSLLGPAMAYLGTARGLADIRADRSSHAVSLCDRSNRQDPPKDRGNQKAPSYLAAYTDERRGKQYSRRLIRHKAVGELGTPRLWKRRVGSPPQSPSLLSGYVKCCLHCWVI